MILPRSKSLVYLGSLFQFLLFLLLFSCTQVRIVDKSRERHFEMRIVKVPLVKWETTDYLRQQYAVNTKLTESQIRALQKEIHKRGWPIADVAIPFGVNANNNENLSDRVISVANPGDRVVIVGELFIDPIGDFFMAKLPTGDFLVPKNDAAPRMGQALPMTAQMMTNPPSTRPREMIIKHNVSPSAPASNAVAENDWSWKNEEERLEKLKLYLQKYPAQQKYTSIVMSRQITVGLPEEMLLLSWGAPLSAKEKAMPLRQIKVYKYAKNYKVYLVDGLIHSWEKK
ncbi:MAG: hypothetical protein QE271_09130 [Bacteriovoracaceae bacterium]|nr:hypothetical protein [Bacteriovoracaceae bacterium]